MEMHVLEAKVCEATLCGSRAARRQMEVNSVEVKASWPFVQVKAYEAANGRFLRAARRRVEVNSVVVKAFLATCPGESL